MSTNGQRLASTSVHKLMKGAVLRKVKGQMQIEDILLPKPSLGEALIKNIGAGICHSDLHYIDGRAQCSMPAVFGHEVSGEIIEINCAPNTSRNLKVGDRVVAAFNMPCGSCYNCENGNEDICETVRSNNLKHKLHTN